VDAQRLTLADPGFRPAPQRLPRRRRQPHRRPSDAEARRREAMAPFVVEEREAFYRGRELIVPAR
jgi:hypothetical protein